MRTTTTWQMWFPFPRPNKLWWLGGWDVKIGKRELIKIEICWCFCPGDWVFGFPFCVCYFCKFTLKLMFVKQFQFKNKWKFSKQNSGLKNPICISKFQQNHSSQQLISTQKLVFKVINQPSSSTSKKSNSRKISRRKTEENPLLPGRNSATICHRVTMADVSELPRHASSLSSFHHTPHTHTPSTGTVPKTSFTFVIP